MTELTLVTDLPRGLDEFTLLQDWADRIGTVSGGDLTIRVFAAGELVSAFEAIDAVETGIVDLFYSSPNYAPAKFSGIAGFSLPFSSKIDADAAEAAWRTVTSDAFNNAPGTGGDAFHFLTAHITGNDVLAAQPSVSDIDGQKVRTAGGEIANVVAALGGFQINLPAVELFTALQTGVIDSAIVPSYFANALSLDGITTYFTAPDGVAFAPILRTLAIGTDAWNGLTSSERAILSAETGLDQSRAFGAQTAALLDAALTAAGSIPLSTAEVADWEAAIATVRAGLSSDAEDIAATFEMFLSNMSGGTGTTGDDTLDGSSGSETLLGLAGNDTLNGSLGNDVLDGGEGSDRADYSDAPGAVQLYLSFGKGFGAFGRDLLIGIENLIGSDFGDRLIGDAGDNALTGGAGNDILKGKGGDDALDGEAGNDVLRAAEGEDLLTGGDGDDILFGLAGEDVLDGNDGADFLYGGRDGDTLQGHAGNDVLRGNLGNDNMSGGIGDDDLRGGGSNDFLRGDSGADQLFGGNGRDRLDGGAGDDVMTGGAGAGVLDGLRDEFVFSANGGFDRVKDFEDGIDVLDLTAFGFSDFSAEVQVLASDRATGLRLDFAGGEILFLEGMTLAAFDASDVVIDV